MRDWQAYVRTRLQLTDIEQQRLERIIEELGLQLQDLYSEARQRGLSADEADHWTRDQVPDWPAFSQRLAEAERPNRLPSDEVMLEACAEHLQQRGKVASVLAALLQDTRHTLRSIRLQPASGIITLLILGLGIGAATTIFSVVNGVLLRPLPYPEPERIAFFQNPAFSTPRLVDWKKNSTSFEELAGAFCVALDTTVSGRPHRLRAGLITPGYLELLGARTTLGRTFAADDYGGPPATAILSYGAWQRRFGGDPGIIGRNVAIEGLPRQVVGVLVRDFASPQDLASGDKVEVWLAFDPSWQRFYDPGMLILSVLGRVRPGLSIAAAEEELNQQIALLARDNPAVHADEDGEPRAVTLAPLQAALTGEIRGTLLMLQGAVVILLLLATANVAGLLLARGLDRTGEVGIRAALGASRGRLVAQLLTESTILALSGGLLGVLLAVVGVHVFGTLDPGNIPLVDRISVDWQVLLFACCLSLLTGLLFGALPARRSGRLDLARLMGGWHASGDRDRGWLRTMLVTAEIALAMILLTGAGLLCHNLLRLQTIDPGFEPDGLVGIELTVNGPDLDEAARRELIERLDRRLEALPNVVGAATAITVPFQSWGSRRRGWLRTEWQVPGAEQQKIWTMVHPATADFFTLLGVDLRGRTFTVDDLTAWPVPVIVSDTFAERLYPEEDPLGRTISAFGWDDDPDATELVVIGVVSGLHSWGLDQGSQETVYVPWERYGAAQPIASVLVKTERRIDSMPEELRQAIWAEEPQMPLPNVFPLEQQVARSLTTPRFYTTLLSTFAVVALLLAGGGIFASMFYSVGRRRQELAIRSALGADSASLRMLVLRRCGALTTAGLLLGSAGAWGMTRFLQGMLFGVTATDPITFITVAVLMAVIAVVATLLPARQAATVDTMQVLRRE